MTAAPPIAPRVTDAELDAFRLAPGFRAAATACGLKPSGRPDLLWVVADEPCVAAGVFTTNRVAAAPVVLDRDHLSRAADRIAAVVANSGCANAVTGTRGMDDARRTATLAGQILGVAPEQVLVLSTGVIGVFLDMEKIVRGLATLASPAARPTAGDAARAILTTDTVPKIASAERALPGGRIRIAGFAKGAGMIHPNMATMLAVVTTDARIQAPRLDQALHRAVERSFNRISVDGDMSTNDTVLVLASGTSGVAVDEDTQEAFTETLTEVCASLARQVARDGEGATRLVTVRVTGGGDETQAHRVGDAIACSSLVKTAIHGNDPNWGRILAAAGASGTGIEPERVRLWFGDTDEIALLERGLPLPFDRVAASRLLARDPAVIHIDLGLGNADAIVWGCDLSAEYVRINAEYTT
jgi:glutamate N-acetyltransferase / amino-acid N-acetyltransferase